MCQRVRHFFFYYSEVVVVDPIERIDPAVVKATALYTDHAPPISIRFFVLLLLLHSHGAFSYFLYFAPLESIVYYTLISILYFFYLNELNDPNTIMYTITAYFLEKMSHIVTLGYSAYRSLTWRKDPLWVYSAQDGNHDRIELHIRRKNSYGPHM